MIDNVNPDHYKGWSNGAEVIDITENLSCNGAQAVQYIARSTRIDGKNKGSTVGEIVEDLRKAVWFAEREILRVSSPVPTPLLPRIWSSMDDIPAGVSVRDRDNETWIATEIAWEVSGGCRSEVLVADRYAPFTEETA